MFCKQRLSVYNLNPITKRSERGNTKSGRGLGKREGREERNLSI
jgi:hypothetical protein